MSETQVLLSGIAALRQQLSAACASRAPTPGARNAIHGLEQRLAEGAKQTVYLDTALRQLTSDSRTTDPPSLPKQLTSRARRILEDGRELLAQLRALADEFEPPRVVPCDDPLAQRYHETVAMTNTALRMVQAFPDAASAQMSLCQGLETILGVAKERVTAIAAILGQRHREAAQLETLACLLTAIHARETVDLQPLLNLAEELVREAQQGEPLRFLYIPPEQPAQFVAGHSLTVAQVMARLVRNDPDFGGDAVGPVLAGLLHDVGMLGVPPSILVQPGPPSDEQRRALEAHTRLGAELIGGLRLTFGNASRERDASSFAEIAASHHERLDGTGYPAGRLEAQLDSLTRLVAVCDVYAALCTTRPYRAALDTRTALTDTLLLAEQGLLDRFHAERLLRLSFYPVGAVVELADGAQGVVVATHMGRRDVRSPARPILALLTDTRGQCLVLPQHLDLAECEDRSIVRTVPKSERSALLRSRYPELA